MWRIFLVVFFVVATLVVSFALGVSIADGAEKAVTHSFRDADAVESFENESAATSTVENTRVRVVDAKAWVRLEVENPNTYPVEVVVELPADIVRPAELGTIEAVDSDVTAEWSSVQNFESGERYTRVRFELEAESSATFAPSKARTLALAWTSKAEETAGLFNISIFGGDGPELEKNEYDIELAKGERVTVDLENPEGEPLEEWYADYSVDGGETWRPVETESDAPVFLREENTSVELVANEEATVKFVAEPSAIEETTRSVKAYVEGWRSLGDLLPDWLGMGVPT